MSDLARELDIDALKALLAAATAYESEILAIAERELDAGETDLGNALEAGFRAKVPLAGGAISAAVASALTQVEADQAVTLKAKYDAFVAWLKGRIPTT